MSEAATVVRAVPEAGETFPTLCTRLGIPYGQPNAEVATYCKVIDAEYIESATPLAMLRGGMWVDGALEVRLALELSFGAVIVSPDLLPHDVELFTHSASPTRKLTDDQPVLVSYRVAVNSPVAPAPVGSDAARAAISGPTSDSMVPKPMSLDDKPAGAQAEGTMEGVGSSQSRPKRSADTAFVPVGGSEVSPGSNVLEINEDTRFVRAYVWENESMEALCSRVGVKPKDCVGYVKVVHGDRFNINDEMILSSRTGLTVGGAAVRNRLGFKDSESGSTMDEFPSGAELFVQITGELQPHAEVLLQCAVKPKQRKGKVPRIQKEPAGRKGKVSKARRKKRAVAPPGFTWRYRHVQHDAANDKRLDDMVERTGVQKYDLPLEFYVQVFKSVEIRPLEHYVILEKATGTCKAFSSTDPEFRTKLKLEPDQMLLDDIPPDLELYMETSDLPNLFEFVLIRYLTPETEEAAKEAALSSDRVVMIIDSATAYVAVQPRKDETIETLAARVGLPVIGSPLIRLLRRRTIDDSIKLLLCADGKFTTNRMVIEQVLWPDGDHSQIFKPHRLPAGTELYADAADLFVADTTPLAMKTTILLRCPARSIGQPPIGPPTPAADSDVAQVQTSATLAQDGVLRGLPDAGIREVHCDSRVHSIGTQAFTSCRLIQKLVWHDKVIYGGIIGARAFDTCNSLVEAWLPEGMTRIGDNAFRSCWELMEVDLPSTLTHIGASAFCGCAANINIRLPDALVHLGDDAFRNCERLKLSDPGEPVRLPKSLTSLGDGAFCMCTSLTEVWLPPGLTHIGAGSFANCSSLVKMVLPAGLVSIGNEAFTGCKMLCDIDLPDSVTTIGERAFFGCVALTLTIPQSVVQTENDPIP